MKRMYFLIPVIIIAALAVTALVTARLWLHADTVYETNADGGAAQTTTEQTMVQTEAQTTLLASAPATGSTAASTAVPTTDPASGPTVVPTATPTIAPTAAQDSTLQNTDGDTVTINGITVNRRKLIYNLDKVTDETVSYVYNQSPDNITIGKVYEGSFFNAGKPGLLIIFKLLGMPHAGGLDCSVAALYDKNTLELISQKTFPYDDCHFTVYRDNKQKGYLLFVGSTTYQGRSQYVLQLYKPGKSWEKIYSAEPPVISELLDDENNIKFELKDDGSVWVCKPVSFDEESQQFNWRHVYNLVWNKDTCTLDDMVPKTYRDAGANMVVDAVSVSPDGRYAISVIPESFRVLIYDTVKNVLAGEFDMLAQDYGFLWSPDSKKVCVTMAAREWIECSVIDAGTLKSADITSKEVLDTMRDSGMELDYKLNDNRPDPYIAPIEWSPDGQKILLSYQWTDTLYNRQNGTFVYNTSSGKISRITANKADTEGGNLPVAKPKDFKW